MARAPTPSAAPGQPGGGRSELQAAFAAARGFFFWAFFFSLFVNLLMLTSPLYMLQVYDRVLASQSVPTLVALSMLVTGLFLIMGVIDYIRGRILARAGAKVQAILDSRVMTAALDRSLSPIERGRPNHAAKDLESIQQFLSSPAPFAFFDAPWTPVYLAALFLFHWQLGVFATAAGVILALIALINEMTTRGPEQNARRIAAEAEDFSEALRREAETLRAMGMNRRAIAQWEAQRAEALDAQIRHSDRAGVWQTTSKTLRMYIQSAILGVGAYLAINMEISAGAMIAGSILMGRALALIDQAIGQWKVFARARRGARALNEFLNAAPPPPPRTQLPKPEGRVTVRNAAVVAPGTRAPLLQGVTFEVGPGEAVGVIGPSGGGKSTLARALAGVWPAAAGEIRLDGAALAQWDADQIGAAVGYLPQDVGLFSGSVADNIARLDPDHDPAAVVQAAQWAGAHEMVLKLADGYNTRVGAGGAQLSGGQRQRIGLARALYGDPAFILLDEPNANLDNEGEQALVRAIIAAKQRRRAVVVMAHRPSAIAACDRLLMIKEGRQTAYGPRDDVLRQVTANHGRQPQRPPQQPPGQRQPPRPAAPVVAGGDTR